MRRSSLFSLSLFCFFVFVFLLIRLLSSLSLFLSPKNLVFLLVVVCVKIQKSILFVVCVLRRGVFFFLFLHARTRERTYAHTKGESTHKNEEKGRTHDLVLILIINHHHFFISSRRHNTNQPTTTNNKNTPRAQRERVCVCQRERERERERGEV